MIFVAKEKIKMKYGQNLVFEILNASDNSYVHIHDWRDLPLLHDWNAIRIETSKFYQMSYTLVKYHLLPKPYQTDCIDYFPKTEYLTQNDCLRKCILKESIKRCNGIPEKTYLFEWEVKRLLDKRLDLNCTKNFNLNEICMKTCHNKDCIKYYYKPFIIASGGEVDFLKLFFSFKI
jgi:hypothetical protein